jgi:coenzyme F420-reducing hydrogenase alpha subunit
VITATPSGGLALKKVGNEILSLLGGREVHPINVRVGGFYRTPHRRELEPLAERLNWAREAALETVHWVAAFDFPGCERYSLNFDRLSPLSSAFSMACTVLIW